MRAVAASAITCAVGIPAAEAAPTVAGTEIKNTATATYQLPGGSSGTVTSNEVSILVDELLDVTVLSTDPGDVVVTPGATNQILTYRITNAGNGNEAFSLVARDTATGDDFNPTATSIILDSNGNGTYDPGVDTVYVPGANDPLLNPDQSLTVFVLATIPAATDGQRGRIDLVATAVTGSGTPGTSFAGKGQGGGDAVVGATGADGEDDGYFAISSATVSLAKSASVTDPFGGTSQVPGSVITYTLVATISGSGTLNNLRITDAIPSGTTFKPSSLTLSGAGLTDATDGDDGEFSSGGITVRLGSVAAGSSRTVTFQVTIN
jgi:uncharacterized repeat protein (TIGR01451 family)